MTRARKDDLVVLLRRRVLRAVAVHVVVLDSRFRKLVREFLRSSGAREAAVRVHLATDDLSRIGDDSPTYVTQAARAHLGRTRVPGQLIPPARLFDESCARAIWREIGALRLTAGSA